MKKLLAKILLKISAWLLNCSIDLTDITREMEVD